MHKPFLSAHTDISNCDIFIKLGLFLYLNASTIAKAQVRLLRLVVPLLLDNANSTKFTYTSLLIPKHCVLYYLISVWVKSATQIQSISLTEPFYRVVPSLQNG